MEQCVTSLDQAQAPQGAGDHLSCDEGSQLTLVRSTNGAHYAWPRLEGHFEKKSLADKLFLRRRFFATKMKESNDVL